MEKPRLSVSIIGGGITGLSTAYYLEQLAAEEGWDLSGVLVEQEERLGGKVLTVREQDFVFEAGPDSFLTSKPWGLQMAKELGLEGEIVYPKAGKVYLLRNGRLHTVPSGMVGLVPSRPWEVLRASFLSWPGRIRAGLEPFVPARKDDEAESLGAFLRRRSGTEMAEALLEPFTAGVYGGDAQEMSLRALFPTLADWEDKHGSLTRGIWAAKKARKGQPPSRSAFFSLRQGAATLTDGIAARLKTFSVITGIRSERIETFERDGCIPFRLTLEDGRIVESDAVVLAIPAPNAADLLQHLAPDVSDVLGRMQYAPAGSIHMTFPRDAVSHPLDGSGFLVPRSEPSFLTGCTWVSTKWPWRAPHDHVLIRAFVGWAKETSFLKLGDDELKVKAVEALRPLLGIVGSPDQTWVHRWPQAMPQYGVEHLSWLNEVDQAVESYQGVFLTGASYRGIGIPDCIRQAKEVAQRIKEKVTGKKLIKS